MAAFLATETDDTTDNINESGDDSVSMNLESEEREKDFICQMMRSKKSRNTQSI